MDRWPRKGLLLTTLLVVCLASQGKARAETPSYTIMTPRPLLVEPSAPSTAGPSPTAVPSLTAPQPERLPAILLPAASGNGHPEAAFPATSPRPPGRLAPPTLVKLVPEYPAPYQRPPSTPRPYFGQLPAPTLEIVPRQQATAAPHAMTRVPNVTGSGGNAQGVVVYNLMFPGAGQDYVVRLNNSGGANSVEFSTGGHAVAPPPGYNPQPSGYPGYPGYGAPPYGQPGYPAPNYPPPNPYTAPVVTPPPRSMQAPFPTPEPETAPGEPVEHRPGPAHELALTGGMTFTSESDTAGGVAFDGALVPRVGLAGWYDFDDSWAATGRFDYQGYTMVDEQAPVSQHHRDEFDVSGGAAYTLPWDVARVAVGGGYAARQVSVASNQAPSLSSPRAFAPSQLFHGPMLEGRVGYVLAPSLLVNLDVQARPYLLAVGDSTITPLGPLFGYGGDASLAWQPLSGLVIRLGYRYDFSTGYRNDWIHTVHGPEAALSWRF